MEHTIERHTLDGTHLTHHLPSDLQADDITARLRFAPSIPEKGTQAWEGLVDGHPFAIWDFKGARWSVYAPGFSLLAMRDLFPEMTP